MNFKIIPSKGYNYKVCYKGLVPPYCAFPQKKIIQKIRGYSTCFYNYENQLVKQIIYPSELWFTEVSPDDPVENFIHTLTYYYPDWTTIDIEKKTI